MLRGRIESKNEAPPAPQAMAQADRTSYPTTEQPFVVDVRPPGVAFYQTGKTFFVLYTLLRGIELQGEILTLVFDGANIVIHGRGLHGVYVHLCDQRIARIIEQGERYADTTEAVVHISRIECITPTEKKRR